MVKEVDMQHALFWPALVILAGATASVTTVQNLTIRSVLYWFVLSPLIVGLVTVYFIAGAR